MDLGLYILGGIVFLVVVVLAYLIYAIASYRAAIRRTRDAAERDEQPDGEARYLAGDTGDLFAAPREGATPPRLPEVRRAEQRPLMPSGQQEAPMPAEPSPHEDSSVPEYSLVAPVELHFTGDPGCVGVRPGTRSHAEFQRLAAILLSDLRAARDR